MKIKIPNPLNRTCSLKRKRRKKKQKNEELLYTRKQRTVRFFMARVFLTMRITKNIIIKLTYFS